MSRVDFEATNARGVVIRTFGDFAHAKRWVAEHASEHDGLHVVEVTTTRRPAYRPRAQLRLVSA